MKWNTTVVGILICETALALLIAIVAAHYAGGASWGLGVFGVLMAVIGYEACNIIPANPPTQALMYILGTPQPDLKGPGLVICPLNGFILSYELEDASMATLAFTFEGVLPGDSKGVEIPIEVYWKKDPHNILAFIQMNDGDGPALDQEAAEGDTVDEGNAKEKINGLLEIMIQRGLRSWVNNSVVGPQYLKQAMAMGPEVANQIVESIAADQLKEIPGGLEFDALASFLFSERPPSAHELAVKDRFDKLPPELQEQIRQQVKDRKTYIDEVRNGKAHLRLLQFGIVIVNLVAGNIEPDSNTRAEMQAVSEARFKAEAQEVSATQIALIAKNLAAQHPDISGEKAIEHAMTQYGLMTQNVTKIEGFEGGAGGGPLGALVAQLLAKNAPAPPAQTTNPPTPES